MACKGNHVLEPNYAFSLTLFMLAEFFSGGGVFWFGFALIN